MGTPLPNTHRQTDALEAQEWAWGERGTRGSPTPGGSTPAAAQSPVWNPLFSVGPLGSFQ